MSHPPAHRIPPATVSVRGEGAFVVRGDAIKDALPQMLKQRLEGLLIDENQKCKVAKAFVPCLRFLINAQQCVDHCSMLHISGEGITEEWLNNYIRVHLLQIEVYDVYHLSLSNNPETIRDRW